MVFLIISFFIGAGVIPSITGNTKIFYNSNGPMSVEIEEENFQTGDYNDSLLKPKPDLVPYNITIKQIGNWDKNYFNYPYKFDTPVIPIRLTYQVYNQGDATAKYTRFDNPNYRDSLIIGNYTKSLVVFVRIHDLIIEPGQYYDYNRNPLYIEVEEKDLGKPIQAKLVVDPYNYIDESREDNNEINITIILDRVLDWVPNKPERPSGPTNILPHINYNYSTKTVDPEGNQIKLYTWIWGGYRDDGGSLHTWRDVRGPFEYGETVYMDHVSWRLREPNNLYIRVQVTDTNGFVSVFSDPAPVKMPKFISKNPFYQLLLRLLELFPILQNILNLY